MPEDFPLVDAETDQKKYNLVKIAEFLDYVSLNKIINKLTDYPEVMTAGKISGIINFNYRLNSQQTSMIIDLLVAIQAISRIYNLALKGSRDLESEYISNIFADSSNPENTSSYLSIRNILENRLNNQTQQYNVNMGKGNNTLAMPINELRGHVKTFRDISESQLSVSTKAQHGMIAASLHDAYVTINNQPQFWNNRTYMKFFFNEDDTDRHDYNILNRERRLSLPDIRKSAQAAIDELAGMAYGRFKNAGDREEAPVKTTTTPRDTPRKAPRNEPVDRMLQTPFGQQYGPKIDAIIRELFDQETMESLYGAPEEEYQDIIMGLYERFRDTSSVEHERAKAADAARYLVAQPYGVKTFAEKFLYNDRRESFARFFSGDNRELIDLFLTALFTVFFEEVFAPVFRVIRGLDVKKFACAYIIKRIYLHKGENLSSFGYYLIRVIAKTGGIRIQ